ncbi:S-layer homology domain-containing protein [Paenibacillus donghaensis]|nr:S-layer homology domain-containing protein [Paenibacillus donghaensis]
MKRSSTWKVFMILALVSALLSGCVLTASSITINYTNEKPSSSEQLFFRYLDGTVVQVPDAGSGNSVTVPTNSTKTIVGGYVTDNGISWVPDYSYGPFGSYTLNVNGLQIHKPTSAVDHIVLAKQPEMDANQPGYLNITLAVYDSDGELVKGRTEIFAHASDPNLVFYNTDPDVNNKGEAVVKEGFSWYTVDGLVTFLIQSGTTDIPTPIAVYSGAQLITDNVLHKITGVKVGTPGDVYSLHVGDSVAMNAEISPADAANPVVTWSVLDGTGSAAIDADGLLTALSAGTVTVQATANDGSGVVGSTQITITAAPTPTPTPAATATAAPTPTPTPAATATAAPTPTPTPAATATAAPTPTPTPAATATAAPTPTPTPAATATAAPTPTPTPAATATAVPTLTPTPAATATAVPTLTPTPATVTVLVYSITVTGDSSVQAGQSIQLAAAVAPAEATDKAVAWSAQNGTGAATIDASGVLTGTSAGTIIVKAAAVDGSAVYGTKAVEVIAAYVGGNGGGSSSTPIPTTVVVSTPMPTPMPVATPAATPGPSTQPKANFNDKVVNIENLISSLSKKVEEAKAQPAAVKFTDTTSHWAAATVDIFIKLGVVNGYKDGTFHPNASITRAEFATIIAKVFDLSSTVTGSELTDISGHWAEASIRTLRDKGVISGYQNGTFKPNQEISRAEIISIIAKIVNLNSVNTAGAPAFSDIDAVWNKDQIEQAAAAGIISGDAKGDFLPKKQASRAEALTIVLHVLQSNPELNTLLESIK